MLKNKIHYSMRTGLALIVFMILLPHTAFAEGEVIDAFAVHVELQPNGSAIVQEEIVYNFGEGAVGRHGIYRNIPKVYKTPDGKEHTIEISSVMVTDGQGNLRQTACEGCDNGGNYMKLKIGDPDVTISGRHLYVIKYTVWGGIRQLRDKDEFYWNVTGNEWKEQILKVRADVVLPMPFQEFAVSAECYVGYKGSAERCNASTTPQEGGIATSVRFTHDGVLQTNQGMTIAVGIPKNIFVIAPVSSVKKISDSVIVYRWWKSSFFGLSIIVPIVMFIMMFRMWRKRGRDPKGRGVIVPEYNIPEGLNTLETAYLLHNTLSQHALSATILLLATKSYLKIERLNKGGTIFDSEDFRITFTPKSDPSRLSEDERELYDSLREHGDSILVSELTHKLVETHSALSKSLPEILTKKGYYVENPGIVRQQYFIAGAVLIGLGFLISFANLALVLSGAIILIFGFLMPKLTTRGAETRERILGFKEYLLVVETDRLDFTDASEKNPKIFEKFLPYAVVFGVEKKWAEKFKDVFTEKTQTPWYGGGNALGAVAFVDEIAKFSTSADSAFASKGGASGGCGSSGGGGGGGGGGSW